MTKIETGETTVNTFEIGMPDASDDIRTLQHVELDAVSGGINAVNVTRPVVARRALETMSG
jgi:hypothetical protein